MKYFKISEFDSPDQLGSGKNMKKKFLKMIDKARDKAGIPFKINSGFRSEAHNRLVGGRVGSSHLKGLAADISCYNSDQSEKILRACIEVGFSRIGISSSFLHIDCDDSKTSAIWLY